MKRIIKQIPKFKHITTYVEDGTSDVYSWITSDTKEFENERDAATHEMKLLIKTIPSICVNDEFWYYLTCSNEWSAVSVYRGGGRMRDVPDFEPMWYRVVMNDGGDYSDFPELTPFDEIKKEIKEKEAYLRSVKSAIKSFKHE